MSKFFDSEVVRDELQDITDLQKELYGNMLNFGDLPEEDKKDHIELLIELLEKQRIMYTRLSLSDDPAALKLKNQIEQSVVVMGFPQGTDINVLFDNMDKTINNLKKNVD